MADVAAEIGVLGGPGLCTLLQDARTVHVDTPYGAPSAPVVVGEVQGRSVAFLPRHGLSHEHPPHRIACRADLWALRSLGVRQVVAPCVVSGLRPELGPGSLVVPDQRVDRTSGRVQTCSDRGAVHVPFADPYCPAGRAAALRAARAADWPVTDGGTLVVVEGPRSPARAGSRCSAQGWSVVGMTGHPEAVLARELTLCCTAVALVTDLDAGVGQGQSVTHAEVLRAFRDSTARLRALLVDVVAALPVTQGDCSCAHALDGLQPEPALP